VSLVFLPEKLAGRENLLNSLGYQARQPTDLGVRAWEEAAVDGMTPGVTLLFKQLRQDRVLRPV
jgi:hypothetical protein